MTTAGYGISGVGYLGEIRSAADGQLYQWVEGIDGLGNPIGFWKKLRGLTRRFRPFLRKALPFVQKYAGMIPGYGTAISAGINTASPYLKQAGLTGIGALYEGGDGRMYEAAPDVSGFGESAGLGEIRAGDDGHLYQWTEGVDGLGNPVGFWKKLRKLARKARPFVRVAHQFAPPIPGLGPHAGPGSHLMKAAGLTGVGETYAAPDGGVYDVSGWIGDDELVGLEQDEASMHGDLMDADEGVSEDVDGIGQCFRTPDSVDGVGAFVPASPASRACPTPDDRSSLFRSIW